MSTIFDITAYGAVCDGVTDDTNAINETVAALLASPHGGLFYIPGPTVCPGGFSATISPGSSFLIGGVAENISKFKTETGITLTFASGDLLDGNVGAKNMSFSALGTNVPNGISLISSGTPNPGPIKGFRNLVFQGASGTTDYFQNCISLNGCTFPTIHNVKFGSPGSSVNSIGVNVMNSQSTDAVDYLMSQCHFWGMNTMVNIGANSEGFSMIGCHGVGVQNGVLWTEPSAGGKPLLRVMASHINAYSYCIKTQNVAQVNVGAGTVLYSASNAVPFVGVYIDNLESTGVSDKHDIDVTVMGMGNKNSNGVVMNNAEYSVIYPKIEGCTTGVWLQANTNNISVVGEANITDSQNVAVLNQGKNNTVS